MPNAGVTGSCFDHLLADGKDVEARKMAMASTVGMPKPPLRMMAPSGAPMKNNR